MMSECCMNCACARGSALLICNRRTIGRLYVDAFYCCPLWKAKKAGRLENNLGSRASALKI